MFRVGNLPKKQFTCLHCTRQFRAPVVRPLRASVEVLLCERCGEPVVIEFYDEILLWFLKRAPGAQGVELEAALKPCPCGGRAVRQAAVRCPDCHKPMPGLEADRKADQPIPLVGEVRVAPIVWDRDHEPLREELSLAALHCLEPRGTRFQEGCRALAALALLDPERSFGLFRRALEANPDELDEDAWYNDDQEPTLFTLGVSLLTAALNGGGRRVLPYVASQLGGNEAWTTFLLEAMRESDQLNRRSETSWLESGAARSQVEALLRAG